TLDMSQDHTTGFEAGAVLEFTRQKLSNPSQAGMTELVFAHVGDHRSAIGGKLCAFCYHDNTEVPATRVAQADALGNLFNSKGALGNENDVGAAGDSAVHGDPS